ncbi:MAG: nucleoside hydrolase [Kiritimatiellaeota bacterium]|nr:nucleoside hydrolase [Kiritimatiellota bacterium]
MKTETIILDTDIGSDIDDALALAYLLREERCELAGVTTVSGEAPLRAEMASAICRKAGRGDVPIHSGVEQAMLTDIRQKNAPQAAALGEWPRERDFPRNTAIAFLRRTIRERPGEITLLAIGPLTNVGILFATDPEIPALLKSLVLMCGQFSDAMRGEWNAINDPHATAIAYGNGFQARPPRHVSYGLDVTMQCQMSAEECRKRMTAPILEPVRDFAEVWFQHCPYITWHDPLAAAAIFEPDLCAYRTGKVDVSLAPPTLGWTIFAPSDTETPHTVAASVDARRFFDRYFSVVK